MKIAIYAQQFNESYRHILTDLFSYLHPDDAVYVEQRLLSSVKEKLKPARELRSFATSADLDSTFDVMLTIGGDGTILRAAAYIHDSGIPILGINAGRLGFLATVQKDQIGQAFGCLRSDNYKTVERVAIEAYTANDDLPIDIQHFALNEITVTRKNTTSMITITTALDGEFLTSYWADGLIVSTPTGSTGYSLSCGGPVIMPAAKNLVITPIAPHNLNARPLIIPDHTEITLTVSSREKNYYVSLDSRLVSLPNKTAITIRKAAFVIRTIELTGESFLHTLRNKLLWGEDTRN
ncbi:MAG: NAD kinase [Capnocytophaga sp.]|nr:NAD kinase [Capnocytophaga sp.]